MIHKNELKGVNEQKEEPKQAEKNPDNRLSQEADALQDKQQERGKSADALRERLKSREFTDSVRKLAYTLKEREENRFNPLINPSAIPYLINAANELDSSTLNPRATLEDMNRSIGKVGRAIKSIGEVPRPQRISDNDESLGRVSFNLQNIDESCRNLAANLGGLEDKNMGETIRFLRSIQDLARDKWAHVAKKRDAVRGYR